MVPYDCDVATRLYMSPFAQTCDQLLQLRPDRQIGHPDLPASKPSPGKRHAAAEGLPAQAR